MRSDAQIAADANRRAGQKTARSNAQIAADANRWAAQRAACNNAQIALESVARANARMLLHSDSVETLTWPSVG
ncbi:unnamed protein product [Sphagnum troendelagicum]|uniref:Uncharacterized protein n=1 Tax=Sphagnum troendelagicum TaxID=128251 RepID=A0ABP0V1X4_9BRYO